MRKLLDTPLIAHIDNNLLDKVAMLVNKNVIETLTMQVLSFKIGCATVM